MKTLTQRVREFLKQTPRINPESGVVFAQRLQKFHDLIREETIQECVDLVEYESSFDRRSHDQDKRNQFARGAARAGTNIARKLRVLANTSTETNYNHISHSHCWDQGGNPACGIPLEKHTQCCLCDLKHSQEG